ncbi:MAG: isoprenyl transferase [Hyphomicrobiales bacterium]
MTISAEQPEAVGNPAPPRHVAIIMDGNGRWAAERGLPRTEGHRQGVEAVRRTIQAAMDLGIDELTLFSFSSENWARPRSEVADLMMLLKRFIRTNLADLHQNGVRLKVIGEEDGVEPEISKLIRDAVELTSHNTRLTLTVAFNYGSRNEIARAAAKLARQAVRGDIDPGAITPELFERQLDTAGTPDPDLLIRTSGEMRLSNFLLWQCAYSEFVFMDCYWPDFGREMLEEALATYHARERRFGGLVARSTA